MQTQFYPNTRSFNFYSKFKKQIKSVLFLSLVIFMQSIHVAFACNNLTTTIPCGSNTCSLSAIQPGICSGSNYEWHTSSSNPCASSCVTNPSAVCGGTYYLYKVTNCWGGKTYKFCNYSATCSYATNCAPCKPTPTTTCGTIACGSTCFNLSNLNPAAVSGTTYEWHTVSCNPSATNTVTNATCVTAGVYYLYAYKIYGSTKSYSVASCGVSISNATNCPISIVIPCGSTCANLTAYNPAAKCNSTIEWHTVSSNPCASNWISNYSCVGVGTYYAYYVKTSCNSKQYTATGSPIVITKAACNLPPVANNDYDSLAGNFAITASVIPNDYDPQGSPLSVNITLLTNPIYGSVTINSNGTFTYTLTNYLVGTDSFKYQLCNALNLCTTAWVYIYSDGSQYRIAHHSTNAINTTNSANLVTEETMSFYPVPTANDININFNAATEQKLAAEILSIDGKMLAQQSINVTIGNNHEAMNVSQLENGIYFIRLVTENKTYLNKFIVSH